MIGLASRHTFVGDILWSIYLEPAHVPCLTIRKHIPIDLRLLSRQTPATDKSHHRHTSYDLPQNATWNNSNTFKKAWCPLLSALGVECRAVPSVVLCLRHQPSLPSIPTERADPPRTGRYRHIWERLTFRL